MLLMPQSSPRKELKIYQASPQASLTIKVFYTKPPSFDVPIESIIPKGQGDEFENDEPVSEKNKRVENSEQPQQGAEKLSGQQLSKFGKQLDKKETCTIGVQKDEVMKTVIEEMQEQSVYLPPEEELSLDLVSLAFRI